MRDTTIQIDFTGNGVYETLPGVLEISMVLNNRPLIDMAYDKFWWEYLERDATLHMRLNVVGLLLEGKFRRSAVDLATNQEAKLLQVKSGSFLLCTGSFIFTSFQVEFNLNKYNKYYLTLASSGKILLNSS